MRKKVLSVLLLALVVVSFLAASDNSVSLTGTPYGMQFVSTTINTNHRSNYGFGFKAGYTHSFGIFLVGADVSYRNYKYIKEHITAHLGNLQVLAKVGAGFKLSEKMAMSVNAGVGGEFDVSRLSSNINFVLEADLNLRYRISKAFSIVAGAEFTRSTAKSKDSVYQATVLNLNPVLGVQMDF